MRSWFTCAAAAAALATAAVVPLAGQASAAPAGPGGAKSPSLRPADGPVTLAPCSYYHRNPDEGYGYVRASSLARRSGPYFGCDTLDYAAYNTKIYYHCWRWGDSVTVNGVTWSSWTYGRIAGTSREGWFSDAYLSNGGAGIQC